MRGSLGQTPDTRSVDVDGRRVRVRSELGTDNRRGPTVVFEAGLSSGLDDWASVFSDVARMAPTLAYDRAGVGQSDADGQRPTPRHVAENLRELLMKVGAPPPYVLVGHSWGGPLIRMYAGLYPGDVAGLVYLDPTAMLTESQSLEYYEARGATSRGFAVNGEQQVQNAPDEMQVAFELEESHFAEFHALPKPPHVPTYVVMAARFEMSPWAGEPCEPRQCYERWVQLRIGWLTAMARESSQGTFLMTTTSGHFIQRDAPELVVDAIRRTLTLARAAGTTRR